MESRDYNKILFIENDAFYSRLAKSVYKNDNYSIVSCGSFAQASRYISDDPAVDLVFIDTELGNITNGIELSEELLKIRKIPLFFITSKRNASDIQKMDRLSSYGYIVKTSKESSIKASLKMALKLHEASKAQQKDNCNFSDLMQYANEHSLTSIVILDKNLNYIWVNQKFLEEHSITDKNLIGKNHYEVFPQLPQKWKGIHQRALQGESFTDEDHLYTDNSGKKFWIRWSCMPWYTKGGSVGGLIIYTEDIDSRKETEEQFKILNERYEAILSSVPDIITEIDSNKVYTWANKAGYDFFGADLIGKEVSYYFAEGPGNQDMAQTMTDKDSTMYFGETPLYRLDGKKRLMAWWNKTIRNPDGSTKGSISIARDITDTREIETNNRRVEARIASILKINQLHTDDYQELMQQIIEEAAILLDSKHGYLFFYDEQKQDFSLGSWTSSIAMECGDCCPLEFQLSDKTGIWAEVVRQRAPFFANSFSEPNPLIKGFPVKHIAIKNFLSVPVFRNSEIVAIAGIANKAEDYNDSDIQELYLMMDAVWKVVERKQANEKIQKLLVEKDLLLKEVHHRIKNNMSTIQSLLSIQADLNTNKKIKTALLDATSRVKSMGLMYDKLYRGKYEGSLSLNDYLSSLVQEITSMFPDYEKISFRFDIDKDLSLPLKQLNPLGLIINELSTNAMKYAFKNMEQGEISLFARKLGGILSIAFEDNGQGLPKNLNLENPSSFGMVLVNSLVSQLKGNSRWAKPSFNEGTGFYLSFAPLEG